MITCLRALHLHKPHLPSQHVCLRASCRYKPCTCNNNFEDFTSVQTLHLQWRHVWRLHICTNYALTMTPGLFEGFMSVQTTHLGRKESKNNQKDQHNHITLITFIWLTYLAPDHPSPPDLLPYHETADCPVRRCFILTSQLMQIETGFLQDL